MDTIKRAKTNRSNSKNNFQQKRRQNIVLKSSPKKFN